MGMAAGLAGFIRRKRKLQQSLFWIKISNEEIALFEKFLFYRE